MNYDPEKHHRHSIRLRDYDYAQAGAYFVTICTHNRKCLFGEVIDGEMHLNNMGQAIQWIWNALPERFPNIQLDHHIIMPNHLHGILLNVGAQFITPSQPPDEGAMNCAPTLGEIIRTFKALSTRYIHAAGMSDFAWQRSYYEHIIRNDDMDRIRQYIIDNPARWTEHNANLEEALL